MIFFKALIFGMTLAIAIGPIAVLIIDHAARGGVRTGLGSAFGAASGDLTYALVAFTAGPNVLPILTPHGDKIQKGADLVLMVFGLWMIWSARQERTVDPANTNASHQSVAGAFRTTYALTVLNPLTIVAFMAFVPQLGQDNGATAFAAVLGLFTGSALIQVGIALGGVMLKHLMSPKGVRALNIASAIGIIAFGCIDLLH
jgi:threonine/homoserine/homoserine lactone efflux protein